MSHLFEVIQNSSPCRQKFFLRSKMIAKGGRCRHVVATPRLYLTVRVLYYKIMLFRLMNHVHAHC